MIRTVILAWAFYTSQPTFTLYLITFTNLCFEFYLTFAYIYSFNYFTYFQFSWSSGVLLFVLLSVPVASNNGLLEMFSDSVRLCHSRWCKSICIHCAIVWTPNRVYLLEKCCVWRSVRGLGRVVFPDCFLWRLMQVSPGAFVPQGLRAIQGQVSRRAYLSMWSDMLFGAVESAFIRRYIHNSRHLAGLYRGEYQQQTARHNLFVVPTCWLVFNSLTRHGTEVPSHPWHRVMRANVAGVGTHGSN